ncbi:MAG: hypothetical protein IJW97_01315 [Clostridia bacterium]|nr:hypothetical protein [Clostridia bacterium]
MNSDQNNLSIFIEPKPPKINTFSALSMAFGIAAISIYLLTLFLTAISFVWIFFFFDLFSFICSSICSILALYFYRRARAQNQKNNMATCGLVCGILSLSLWLLTILSFAWFIILLMISGSAASA